MSYGKVWIYSNGEKYSGVIINIEEPRMRGQYTSPILYPSEDIQEEELETLVFKCLEVECYDLPHTTQERDIDSMEICELNYPHIRKFEYNTYLDVEKLFYDYNASCLVIKAY